MNTFLTNVEEKRLQDSQIFETFCKGYWFPYFQNYFLKPFQKKFIENFLLNFLRVRRSLVYIKIGLILKR